MRPLKSLTLEAMVDFLATTFRVLEDARAVDQLTYPLHDTLLSGFALMFFQHPSLLQFQRAMKQKRRRCNLESIFGVHDVPSDTQMREILDGVDPEVLRALLPQLWEKVRRAGGGHRFTTTLPSGQQQGTYYTVALDGSEYFHSTTIQCPHCLRQPRKIAPRRGACGSGSQPLVQSVTCWPCGTVMPYGVRCRITGKRGPPPCGRKTKVFNRTPSRIATIA